MRQSFTANCAIFSWNTVSFRQATQASSRQRIFFPKILSLISKHHKNMITTSLLKINSLTLPKNKIFLQSLLLVLTEKKNHIKSNTKAVFSLHQTTWLLPKKSKKKETFIQIKYRKDRIFLFLPPKQRKSQRRKESGARNVASMWNTVISRLTNAKTAGYKL